MSGITVFTGDATMNADPNPSTSSDRVLFAPDFVFDSGQSESYSEPWISKGINVSFESLRSIMATRNIAAVLARVEIPYRLMAAISYSSMPIDISVFSGGAHVYRRRGEAEPEITYDPPFVGRSAASSGLEMIIARLARLQNFEDDWDTYGGKPPSETAIAKAIELITLIATYLEPPFGRDALPRAVSPLSDGGVLIEWDSNSKAAEIEIDQSGDLAFLEIAKFEDGEKYTERDHASEWETLNLIRRIAES